MERPSFLKRRGDFGQGKDSDAKKAKTDNDGKPKKSFAERMMEKQGWQKGMSLGATGVEGIVEPIQVQLRPTGAGIGAIKEKTKQQKQEEKRKAEQRGEEYDDSSEEERKTRKRRAAIKKAAGVSSGGSTPGAGRTKQRFTVEDIPEAMVVPPSLLEVVDAKGNKLLTSALTLGGAVPQESPTTKIAKRARLDLEAYASAFNDLEEEKRSVDFQNISLLQELDKVDREAKRAQEIANAAADLQQLQTWDSIIAKLEQMHLGDYGIDGSIAVAAIHPFFKQIMSTWEPLEDALENVVNDLSKIPAMLSSPRERHGHDEFERVRPQATTPFETMLWTYYLPKMRSAIINWDPNHGSLSLIAIVAAWSPITPKFIQNSLLKQIITKLSAAVHSWNPRKSIKKKTTSHLLDLIIPWLSLLPPEQTDPRSASGLVSDVKRKFRSLVDTWDLSRGVIPDIERWRRLLAEEFDRAILGHLVPKLAELVEADFEINPAEQDMEPLARALQFTSIIKTNVMGELLAAKLFPKLQAILHMWITSDSVDFNEVAQWLDFWKETLGASINDVPAVSRKWEDAYAMINTALDLGERAKTDLPLPEADIETGVTRSPQPSKATTKEPPSARKEVLEEATFRDVVESWCSEESLLLIPLREAHEVTGSPLFRITASATGRGGVVVYMRGDVLYAQNKKDKGLWEPMGLEERLVDRAEGK